MNVMTLYADLAQRLELQDVRPGSISTKRVDGKPYLYAVEKDGIARIQRFLGPAGSPDALAEADRIRRAAREARELRSTVALLKQARVPGPTLLMGRILEVLSNAGLFNRGITLVGTAAYQTYACLIGSYLQASALMTNDIDLSVAEFVASGSSEDIGAILKRADPTFEPYWGNEDRLPKVFRTASGFSVDIVTKYGRGRRSPVLFQPLGCSAEALGYAEYPVGETLEAVVLYGSGVLVRVPTPLRYAIHKLIVAQQRKPPQAAKRAKDLMQARELIDVLLVSQDAELQDALDEARLRGKGWRTAINASLHELGRNTKQGQLPLPKSAQAVTGRR